MRIERADFEELAPLSTLLNRYRMANGHPDSLPEAEHYLFVQLSREDALYYLAWNDATPVGFIQLVPTVRAQTLSSHLILSDCYVDPETVPEGMNPTEVLSLLVETARAVSSFRGDDSLVGELSTSSPQVRQALESIFLRQGFQPCPEARRFELAVVPALAEHSG
jgi:hypothetical protein